MSDMTEQPKIPADRPSSWTVDENGEWVEQPFLVVEGSGRRCYDYFDTSSLGKTFIVDTSPIPFKDGHILGGSWSGTGEDFTVDNE